MRSFSFDVLERTTASGGSRIVEGAQWYRLAKELARAGSVTLVLNSRNFAGYGRSFDVGYTRHNFTVVEKPGAFVG